MDIRWAGDDINRIRALAEELVGLQPDIILTLGASATAAVQQETRTIPIVFATWATCPYRKPKIGWPVPANWMI